MLDLAGGCVDAVNSELIVSVVENGIELLHKDISQDVLIRVELVAYDANLADFLAIFVDGIDKVVLWLNSVGAVTYEIETESFKVLSLALTFVEASVGRLEIALEVNPLCCKELLLSLIEALPLNNREIDARVERVEDGNILQAIIN